jgi:hypothetical protein
MNFFARYKKQVGTGMDFLEKSIFLNFIFNEKIIKIK